ncbi:MAG TPA: HAMP domain-containing sensor histidine kinase [Candidatus Paceibacterota bacterium]|nr:HAMP domain-containing sensor histidine kinase [Candidatus Paceibacterota bacterium]
MEKGFSETTHEIDIEKKASTEEELRKENEELKAQLENSRKSMSIVSHDLKASIGSTMKLLDFIQEGLKNGYTSNENLANLAGDMKVTTGKTYKLLEDLLELGKIQRGEASPEILSVNLREEIENSIFLIAEKAKEKEIEIKNEVQNDVQILADKKMIESVIRNIASNAVKYTNKGGKILISSEKVNDKVEISIEDNGKGISKEQMEKIFKSIVRSYDGTHGETGSGVGLTICNEMINKMNGTIRVQSEEGKGSKFTISIPSA